MKCYSKILAFLFIILFMIPVTILNVSAQSNQESSAEISILPVGQIPLVQPNKQATINLSYLDSFGMNWTKLQNFLGDTGFRKIASFILTRIIWPIIHPAWKPLLGYTSVILKAEVLGNPNGWVASISPNTIGQSTDGTRAALTLKVFVTNAAVDNLVTVRVSATRYAKDGSLYGTSNFDIPVRSAKLNHLQIIPDQNSKEVAPDSIVQFTVSITNQGYFVDVFAVKTNSTDSLNAVLSESSFVLQPGATEQVTLWVATPETFFDPGTAHTINISAYSLKYPQTVFVGGVTVVTRGFYVSPLTAFIIGIVIIIILFVYFVFFYLRARRERNVYGKPEKPWKLPEEQQHLRELKRENNEAYEQERLMMEDEYKSAMLYYKDYRQSLKAKPTEPTPEKKEKPKKPLPTLFKKSEKPPKVEEKKVEAIVPAEDKTKEKALAKIQREQAKQLKKKKE